MLPPAALQVEFESVIVPLRSLLSSLLAYNSSLRAIRNLLLPKLVTGQIDVSELDLDALVESLA